MKLFIIFTLLVSALSQGLVEDIIANLNQTVQETAYPPMIDDANDCVTNLIAQLQTYSDNLQNNQAGLTPSSTDSADLFNQFDPIVQTACQSFIQDLDQYVAAYGNETGAYNLFQC